MNAGSGHVCVSRGVCRIIFINHSPLSFSALKTEQTGREGKNTLLYLRILFGVCPLCTNERFFKYGQKHTIYNFIRNTCWEEKCPYYSTSKETYAPYAFYAAHASARVCVYVICIFYIYDCFFYWDIVMWNFPIKNNWFTLCLSYFS